MKTIRLLLLSTLLVFGFTPAVLAGEPNSAVFGNEQPKAKADKSNKSGNSASMSSGDCPPKSIHEKDELHTGARHSEVQHTGVLKE